MPVIKNMVVRVGGDFSELFGETQKANRKIKQEFSDMAKSAGSANVGKAVKDSISGASKALDSVNAEIKHTEAYFDALSKRLHEAFADDSLDTPQLDILRNELDKVNKKLDQLEGKKLLLEVEAETEDAEADLQRIEEQSETSERAAVGFWASIKDAFRAAREETLNAADETEQDLDRVEKKTNYVAKAAGGLWNAIKSGAKSLGSHLHHSRSGADGLWKSLKRVGGVAVGLKLVSAVTGRLRSIIRSYIADNAALQAQTEALKSGLGNSLAPAINLVTNALSAALPYILAVSNAIGSLISMLFGSGWTTIAEGANAAAAATGGAAAAQEEYNRQLAGFDEITRLEDEKSSGGGGGGTGGIKTEITAAKIGWLDDIVGSISSAMKTGDWDAVGETVGTKVGDELTKAKNWIKDADFAAVATHTAEGINGFVKAQLEADTSLGEVVAEFFNQIFKGAYEFFTTIEWDDAKDLLRRNVNDFFAVINWDIPLLAMEEFALSALTLLRDKLFSPIAGFFAKYLGGDGKVDWLDNAITDLETKISDLKIKINGEVELTDNSDEIHRKAKKLYSGKFGEPVGSVKFTVRNDAPEWLATTRKLWSGITNGGTVSSGNISLDVYNGAKLWRNKVATMWDAETSDGPVASIRMDVKNTAQAWNEEAKNYLDNYTGTPPSIDVLLAIQKDGWNSLDDIIGNVSKTLTIKAHWTEPANDKEQVLSKAIFDAKGIPTLYMAAQGGIVNAATLFGNTVVGEAGKEAIVPLKRNTEWLDMVADRLSQNGGTNRPIEVVVQIDGTVVGRKVVNYINRQAVATGVNPLSAYI